MNSLINASEQKFKKIHLVTFWSSSKSFWEIVDTEQMRLHKLLTGLCGMPIWQSPHQPWFPPSPFAVDSHPSFFLFDYQKVLLLWKFCDKNQGRSLNIIIDKWIQTICWLIIWKVVVFSVGTTSTKKKILRFRISRPPIDDLKIT